MPRFVKWTSRYLFALIGRTRLFLERKTAFYLEGRLQRPAWPLNPMVALRLHFMCTRTLSE